jgi:hypothetical protein
MTLRLLSIAVFSSALLCGAYIDFDSPHIPDSGVGTCAESAGTYYCDTVAFFDSYTLNQTNSGAISPLFQQAFDSWNASVNKSWTLANGGALGGYFDVTSFAPEESTGWTAGGVLIDVDISHITGLPALTDNESLIWVQALYVNYDVNSNSIIDPVYHLDLASSQCNVNGPNAWCAPAYPYQYASGSYSTGHFHDEPSALYQGLGSTQAFFDANTYLAIENTANNTLTVYDGVCYGFQNEVSSSRDSFSPIAPGANTCGAASAASPEPGVLTLCISGLAAMLSIGRKRYRAVAALRQG